MTKSDLVRKVSEDMGCEMMYASRFVDSIFDIMSSALIYGEDVKIPTFGVLHPEITRGHKIYDVHHDEYKTALSSATVKFRASKYLKNSCTASFKDWTKYTENRDFYENLDS